MVHTLLFIYFLIKNINFVDFKNIGLKIVFIINDFFEVYEKIILITHVYCLIRLLIG